LARILLGSHRDLEFAIQLVGPGLVDLATQVDVLRAQLGVLLTHVRVLRTEYANRALVHLSVDPHQLAGVVGDDALIALASSRSHQRDVVAATGVLRSERERLERPPTEMLVGTHHVAVPARRLGVGLTLGDLDDLRDESLEIDEVVRDIEQLGLIDARPLANFLVLVAVARCVDQIDFDALATFLAGEFAGEKGHDLGVQFSVVTHYIVSNTCSW
jgi:hypothetical protein